MLPSFAAAQYDSVKRRPDVFRFADGIINTYTSPVRWKGKDWLKFSAIAGSTALLTVADHPVRNFWIQQNGKVFDCINVAGYHYGKPYSAFMFSGGFYAAGLLFKNEWARETGLALSTALMSSAFLEMGLKPLIGRARPGRGNGNYDMDFFNPTFNYHSFPSGHASIAFTISFVLAKRTESVPVKIFFYTLAGSTAICRLYSDAHWISDVAFGSIIAWYCSEAAIKRLQSSRLRKERKTKMSVTPYPGGITLRAVFR